MRLSLCLALLAACNQPAPSSSGAAATDAGPAVAPDPRGTPEALPPSPLPLAPAGSIERVPVVVVGGGIAGLVTTYELQKQGVTAHLLEASDRWGGRVATAYYADALAAEFGLQELWDDNPLLGIVRELGIELDSGTDAPWSSVLIDGKPHAFVHDTVDEYFASLLAAHVNHLPARNAGLEGRMLRAAG
jgi:hypothetical protein